MKEWIPQITGCVFAITLLMSICDSAEAQRFSRIGNWAGRYNIAPAASYQTPRGYRIANRSYGYQTNSSDYHHGGYLGSGEVIPYQSAPQQFPVQMNGAFSTVLGQTQNSASPVVQFNSHMTAPAPIINYQTPNYSFPPVTYSPQCFGGS